MTKRVLAFMVLLALVGNRPATSQGTAPGKAPPKAAGSSGQAAMSADALDALLAPIALYPDTLLSEMVLPATNPGKVGALAEWLRSHESLKGTELQDAAREAGFDASFAALVVFPDVVDYMAGRMDWTASLGKAFTSDRSGVFASIQRLRGKAH